jgi:D-psicose/D-tagatose/L-ribulose 3-epimerase
VKFAICNETFQGWDWARTCRFVADCGYDAIELAPFTLSPDVREVGSEERARIRGVAEEAGLPITGLHWLMVSPKGLSLTSPVEDLRRESSDYLVALADFCGDVGGEVMVLGSPQQRRVPEGETVEAATERFLTSVRPALDRAAERGVVISLEPLPPPEADLLLTLSEAAVLIERLNHPAAKTIFDVKSASWEGKPLGPLFEQFAGVVAHVHANDANRRGPGFGDTDFRPILAAMEAAKYAGYVSVEVFDYTPDPETIARESLRYMRACLAG